MHGDEAFRRMAHWVSEVTGRPWTFALALGVVLTWLLTGPLFGFSDTWQLVINTGTTIVTFLMVFLIQNTQNRDARAMQLKLDELIRVIDAARNEMVDLEDLSDAELERFHREFREFHRRLQEESLRRGRRPPAPLGEPSGGALADAPLDAHQPKQEA